MPSWLVPYQIAFVLSVLTSGVAAGIAWVYRGKRGSRPLLLLLILAAVWSGTSLAQLTWRGTPLALFWQKVALVCVVVLVPTLLVTVLSYTGREEYITPRTIGLLAIEPVVFSVLLWTNERHNLVFYDVELTAQATGGLSMMWGPGYVVHTVYSYVLVGAAVVLLCVFAIRSERLYRRQAAAVLVAVLAPWLVSVAGHALGMRFSVTPVTFSVTGLAFTWAVVREDFLDIRPVATEIVFETVDTAGFVVNADGRVIEANDAACELVDGSPGRILGAEICSLFDDVPDAEAIFDDVASTRGSTTHEFALGDRYVRLQASTLRDRWDEPLGHVFLVVDLTEQRRREEELRRRNEQLDRFAGVVSHDLRNPLEVASGNHQLARETGAEKYFDRTEAAHDRMARLIDDILVLARQRDHRIETETLELAALVSEYWGYVQTRDATLDVALDGMTLEADGDRLGQLLENCFRNAIEHGGDDVTVTVGALTDGEGFYVEDDGHGFDDADPDSVFEDGYTTESDGTGFGLSIVDEIATLHGWRVDATEADTGGARLEIRLASDDPRRRAPSVTSS